MNKDNHIRYDNVDRFKREVHEASTLHKELQATKGCRESLPQEREDKLTIQF